MVRIALRRAFALGTATLILVTALWGTHVADAGNKKEAEPEGIASADRDSSDQEATIDKKSEAGKKEKPVSGRLPAHYAKVVTPEQRTKIYEIQTEFRPKINAARETLKTLVEEQNERISAVLTSEQKKQIEEAAGRSTRKRSKAGKETHAPSDMPASPPESEETAPDGEEKMEVDEQ